MNRTARRHLLARMDAASRPLYAVQVPDDEARAFFFEAITRGRATIVLPPAAHYEVLPRSLPAVVAGKGKRHRGVRERVPSLRLFSVEGAASKRACPGGWKALAMSHIFRRDAVRD